MAADVDNYVEKLEAGVSKPNVDQFNYVKTQSHYSDKDIQPIDYMKSVMTPEQMEGYLRGNVIKYISRYPDKHADGLEDLAKAKVYLAWLLEYLVNQDVTVK